MTLTVEHCAQQTAGSIWLCLSIILPVYDRAERACDPPWHGERMLCTESVTCCMTFQGHSPKTFKECSLHIDIS